MSAAILKRKIKDFGKRVLSPRGYLQKSSWAFERDFPALYHGICFVKGLRGLEGSFNVDIYWRFNHSSFVSDDVMDYCQRIGKFSSGVDEWYPIEDDKSYERIERIFTQAVEPFLKEHESIAAIIHGFEKGLYDPAFLFGVDIGWRTYNIGFCYLWLGQKEKALSYLNELVDQYSSNDYDWVQKRKKVAADAIASISLVKGK